jgi:hypothetical protein
MARKTLDFTITDDGRDKDKVFHLVEMPATQGERWALRTLRAALLAGMPITPDMISGGMQSIAAVGVSVLVSADLGELFALGDELMACVSIKPDPRNPGVTRPLIESDIEEIKTRFQLKMEAFKLHTDFFKAGVL